MDMDIFSEWEKIENNNFNQHLNKTEIMKAIYQDSKSTISTLKLRLLYKIRYIVGFLFLFTSGMVYFNEKINVVMLLLLWIVSYAIGGILLFRKYKQMDQDNGDANALTYMKHNAIMIKSALSIEKSWGITFFPIAIISGFSLNGVIKGENFQTIFSDNQTLIAMLVSIVVIIPIAMYVTSKMNNSAYGQYIEELDEKIKMMEKVS